MQACNRFSGKQLVKKAVVLLFCSVLFSESLFSQEKLDMPPMPKMPDMPSISFPEYSTSFYRPAMPENYKKENANDKNKPEKDAAETDKTEKTKQKNPQNTLMKALISGEDVLSASDISSLYELGMFGDVSSIMGYGQTDYSSAFSSTNTTNLMLQQVLNELEEMKESQKKEAESDSGKLEQKEIHQDIQNFRQREPSILRFRINGYNIADSLSTVFFSEPDVDGSFLLTADRKYFANQQPRTETFYFLFKTMKGNGTTTTYEVTPSIVQDRTNTNSFVYQLCQQKNLTAEKTGNLIVFHYTSDDFNADMLLDLDK